MHRRYIALLRKAVDPSDAGKGLYFSPTADLTLTQQRAAELEEQGGKEDGPFTTRTEQRFFWNRHLLAPFLGEQPCLQDWCLPPLVQTCTDYLCVLRSSWQLDTGTPPAPCPGK